MMTTTTDTYSLYEGDMTTPWNRERLPQISRLLPIICSIWAVSMCATCDITLRAAKVSFMEFYGMVTGGKDLPPGLGGSSGPTTVSGDAGNTVVTGAATGVNVVQQRNRKKQVNYILLRASGRRLRGRQNTHFHPVSLLHDMTTYSSEPTVVSEEYCGLK